ncbi:hypothetical protein BDQ17DRAFT_1330022 [Cyathus striatus]|nr:hypothetical protein BDQ17DRAFT_1330022 [Cyathus striatus]
MANGSSRSQSRVFHDEDYEKIILAAIAAKRNGTYKFWRDAAKAYNHMCYKDVGKQQQLLNPTQEATLLDWSECDAEATELVGRRAGKRFASRFVDRHLEIVLTKPAKPDPKHAESEYFTI